jgi:hypothetical protein
VQGEAFVLKATMASSKQSIDLLKKQYEEFKESAAKELKELTKKQTTLAKERETLDLEVHTHMKNEHDKQSRIRFDHKMIIDKDAAYEKTLEDRHKLETDEMEKLKKTKEEEKKTLEQGLADHEAKRKGDQQYQD